MRDVHNHPMPDYHIVNWKDKDFHKKPKGKLFGNVSLEEQKLPGAKDSEQNRTVQTSTGENIYGEYRIQKDVALLGKLGIPITDEQGERKSAIVTDQTKEIQSDTLPQQGVLASSQIKSSALETPASEKADTDVKQVLKVTQEKTNTNPKQYGNAKQFQKVFTMLKKYAGKVRTIIRERQEKKEIQSSKKNDTNVIHGDSYLLDSYNKKGERSVLGKEDSKI